MEDIILLAYAILLAVCSTFLNGMVIYLTQKYEQLRVPRMYTRMAYAAFDILFALSSAIHYIVATQFIDGVPVIVKCFTGDFTIAMFFGTTQLTAFIALERYFYFCKPMLYNRYFTLRSITVVSIVIFAISQGYMFIKEFLFGREIQPLIGMCSFTHPVFHNIGNLLIFILPAVVVTIFSIFNIIKLMRAISIQPSSFPNKAANSEPMLRRRAAKKGLR